MRLALVMEYCTDKGYAVQDFMHANCAHGDLCITGQSLLDSSTAALVGLVGLCILPVSPLATCRAGHLLGRVQAHTACSVPAAPPRGPKACAQCTDDIAHVRAPYVPGRASAHVLMYLYQLVVQPMTWLREACTKHVTLNGQQTCPPRPCRTRLHG
jgi:hypothetical protein